MTHLHVAEKMHDLGVFIQWLREPIVQELTKLKEAFPASLRELDSRYELLRVLDRAADDPRFIAQLTYQSPDALRDYHLTLQAEAALLSGDVNWIEVHIGKLNDRRATWLQCRLEQEIW